MEFECLTHKVWTSGPAQLRLELHLTSHTIQITFDRKNRLKVTHAELTRLKNLRFFPNTTKILSGT